MADWNDILNDEEPLNEQELMKYLGGNPSEEARFAIEKQMAGSAFVNDAVEGLQQLGSPEKLQALKDQLNRQLQKETSKRTKRKKKRGIADQQWLIVAILAILLLCIAGYLMIHFNAGK
ncbi:MAG: hypothetical protein I8H66_07365 [Sphingobacteriia bacterium]|nr:hypothetical protein [Sphingobacteriia bacterium]